MRITNTIPQWKMPDEEKIPHTHSVRIRQWAEFTELKKGFYFEYIVDLTKYYEWAEENYIELEHNLLILGEDRRPTSIMFTFWNAIDAMAFKLTWY